jgi:hypothetical protein
LKIQLINYLDQRFNGEVLIGQTTRKVELPPRQIATLAVPMPGPEKNAAAHARSTLSPETLTISVRVCRCARKPPRAKSRLSALTPVACNLKVGYVRGFDFSLPNALNALGVESKELSADEIKTGPVQLPHSSLITASMNRSLS